MPPQHLRRSGLRILPGERKLALPLHSWLEADTAPPRPVPQLHVIPISQLSRPRPLRCAQHRNRKQSCAFVRVRAFGLVCSRPWSHLWSGSTASYPPSTWPALGHVQGAERAALGSGSTGSRRRDPAREASHPREWLWLVPNSLNRERWAGSSSRSESRLELENHSRI